MPRGRFQAKIPKEKKQLDCLIQKDDCCHKTERFKFHFCKYFCAGAARDLSEESIRLDSKNPHRFSSKKQKTVTRTFRIRGEWDDILKQEAEKQGTSVNVLVNSIFQKYALFDRLAQGHNSISLTQQTFHTLLSCIPEESIALAGEKSGSTDIQNLLDLMGLPSNYDSFAYLVSTHFGGDSRAMWFTCCRHLHENSDSFHLQHNLGRGWSIFLQKYLLSYLKTLKISGETRVYDYAVNLAVPRPR